MKKALFIFLVVIAAFIFFSSSTQAQKNKLNPVPHSPVCRGGEKDSFRCHARVVVDKQGNPATTTLPSGYGPLQFTTGYNVPNNVSTPQTIAIVDAYNDPYIFQDVNTYSTTYGIQGLNSCAASSGSVTHPCFQKVNEFGGTSYPGTNSGWALEISLDVEVAHAMCQNCNILLVEANSASYNDLMTAVDRARLMGARIISNSYGSNEFSGENSYDTHFQYPGIVFTFSSGDSGYGPSYPAASSFVTSVGGTSLLLNSNNSYLGESVWNGAGSGCSAYETKPSWQTDTLCGNRTIADVSADADPSTGAAVYDSVRYSGHRGWFQVGGTSLASPLIAATYALAGGVTSSTFANSVPYVQSNYGVNMHDVTSGSNGSCGTYLCNAGTGYDGPSGLGTPDGTGAF